MSNKRAVFNPADIPCSVGDVAKCLDRGESLEPVFDKDTGLPITYVAVNYQVGSGTKLETVLEVLGRGIRFLPQAQRAAFLVGLRKEYAPQAS